MTVPALGAGGRRGGLLRQRDFRLFWFGETTSQVGTSVSFVALPLVAVEVLHASTLVVGALTAAVWFPWLVIGLPAGALVDRLPRRATMLVCDAVSLAAFLSIPVAAWAGVLGVPQLVAAAVVAGAASVFFDTAYQVYLPSLIAADDLTEGNAKLKGSRSAAQIAGPGLAGVLAQAAGATAGLLADAVSFAVSLACLTAIGRPEPPLPAAERPAGSMRTETIEGLRFVVADPFLRPSMIYAATANFGLTGVDALLVVFLIRTVGASAATVGVVLAIGAIGGVAGAAAARPLARRYGTSRTVIACVVGGLPAALLVPLTGPGAALAFVIVANLAVGAAIVASNVVTSSFRQTYVPKEMLGRVSSCVMTASYATMPIAGLTAGVLGQAVGIRPALWALCAVIAASGLILVASPMRTLRDLPAQPAITDPDRHCTPD